MTQVFMDSKPDDTTDPASQLTSRQLTPEPADGAPGCAGFRWGLRQSPVANIPAAAGSTADLFLLTGCQCLRASRRQAGNVFVAGGSAKFGDCGLARPGDAQYPPTSSGPPLGHHSTYPTTLGRKRCLCRSGTMCGVPGA